MSTNERKTNRRLYECVDCGNRMYYNRFRMSRRCKPHCTECGSTFLDPVCDLTHDEMAKAHDGKEAQIAHIKDEASWRIS